jgi:hypothetical protein
MELLAFLALLYVAANLIALGFSVVVVVRGRMRLSRSRTLTGTPARLVGVACIVVVILLWRFCARMIDRFDPS